jgi:hypothetical protein
MGGVRSRGGGKLVRWTNVIARTGVFVLETYPPRSEYWQNLRLVRLTRGIQKKRGVRRVWYLGWNGERLQGSSDSQNLRIKLPDIYSWVVKTMGNRGLC